MFIFRGNSRTFRLRGPAFFVVILVLSGSTLRRSFLVVILVLCIALPHPAQELMSIFRGKSPILLRVLRLPACDFRPKNFVSVWCSCFRGFTTLLCNDWSVVSRPLFLFLVFVFYCLGSLAGIIFALMSVRPVAALAVAHHWLYVSLVSMFSTETSLNVTCSNPQALNLQVYFDPVPIGRGAVKLFVGGGTKL